MLTDHRYASLAHTLADALWHDPFYVAITPVFAHTDAERRERLARYLMYSLQEAEQLGTVVISQPDAFGAAAWLFPQAAELQRAANSAKQRVLAAVLDPQGLANYLAMLAFMHPRAQALVPATSWYLSIIGIAPNRQGQGLGAQLLTPTLAQADKEEMPCYLETFNSRSVHFYHKLGFQEVGSYREPITAERCRIMLRAPQRA